MKILLVEDDIQIAANLKILLERETYAVTIAASISEGTDKLFGDEYDLMICDRRLPDGDGLDIVKKIRSENLSLPCLMLTAKDSLSDQVEGLDVGADDYLSKPFESKVLLARIRALLRRRKKVVTKPNIVVEDVVIDQNKMRVERNGKLVPLSPREYALLNYLVMNSNRVVERIEMLSHVWNEEVDLFSNTVDVHVRYLRKKLGNNIIQTIRGKGYAVWRQ